MTGQFRKSQIAFWLLTETVDLVAAHVQRTEAAGRNGRGQGGLYLLCAVEGNQVGDVDVTDAIAIG